MAKEGTCRDRIVYPVAKIIGYQDIPNMSEEELLKAMAN